MEMNVIKKLVINFLDSIRLTPFSTGMPLMFFLLISIVSGSVYVWNIGSFSGPDMHVAHYRAAIAVATGQNFSESTDRGFGRINYISGSEKYLNSGNGCVDNKLVTNTIASPLISDGGGSCIEAKDKSLTENEITTPVIIQYPPLSYLPQATGIKIGMIEGMQPIDAQFLARYLNLLSYILMIILSIAIIPRGKWFIAFIGVLPPSLFLASSLSADSLNIAWNILFVSYIMRLYLQKKKVTLKQGLIVFALGVGLFMLKVAYVPILVIMLALKPSVIKPKAKWLLFLSIVLLGTIMYVVWSSNWSSLNALVDTSVQMSLIVHNIHKAMVAILLNIYYLPSMLLNQHTMYVVIAIITLTLMIGRIFSMKLVKPRSLLELLVAYKLQLLGLVALVGSLGLTYAALLLTWTNISEYGWLNIQGFQGRYIIPLLPLLVLVYYLPGTPKKNKELKQSKGNL